MNNNQTIMGDCGELVSRMFSFQPRPSLLDPILIKANLRRKGFWNGLCSKLEEELNPLEIMSPLVLGTIIGYSHPEYNQIFQYMLNENLYTDIQRFNGSPNLELVSGLLLGAIGTIIMGSENVLRGTINHIRSQPEYQVISNQVAQAVDKGVCLFTRGLDITEKDRLFGELTAYRRNLDRMNVSNYFDFSSDELSGESLRREIESGKRADLERIERGIGSLYAVLAPLSVFCAGFRTDEEVKYPVPYATEEEKSYFIKEISERLREFDPFNYENSNAIEADIFKLTLEQQRFIRLRHEEYLRNKRY